MSAMASIPTTPAPVAGSERTLPRSPFGLTVAVELRKTVDTRAGRVLLAVVLLLSLLSLGLQLVEGDETQLTYTLWMRSACAPAELLLPVLGVLAMTSEWTQRTALSTFTLTPRRMWVLTAKLIAAVVVGLVVTLLLDWLAAAAVALRAVGAGRSANWDGLAGALSGSLAAVVLAMVLGAALGALLMNSAGALVAYFVAPNVAGLAATFLPDGRGRWFDPTEAMHRLTTWDLQGHVGPTVTALTLWIALPLVLGLWRAATRDVS